MANFLEGRSSWTEIGSKTAPRKVYMNCRILWLPFSPYPIYSPVLVYFWILLSFQISSLVYFGIAYSFPRFLFTVFFTSFSSLLLECRHLSDFGPAAFSSFSVPSPWELASTSCRHPWQHLCVDVTDCLLPPDPNARLTELHMNGPITL